MAPYGNNIDIDIICSQCFSLLAQLSDAQPSIELLRRRQAQNTDHISLSENPSKSHVKLKTLSTRKQIVDAIFILLAALYIHLSLTLTSIFAP